ncbi:hypothetical protein EDD15DRAFT_2371628 [Pisolithus albus]|nr:hypothetical protein EDD15DRAFT_2371628 [Pisolithus albus]
MNLQRYVPVLILFFSAIPIKHLLLTGYFLWPIATQVQRHMLYAVHRVCSTEWFRETGVCRVVAPLAHGQDAARYAMAIQTELSGLEGLLSGTNEIVPLVRSLTESRMSISDLVVLVKSSALDSRVALAEELTAIATDTKAAARGLQKFFAQVQGTVDVMQAVNENLLHLLQHRISPISVHSVYCYTVQGSLDRIESRLEVVRDLAAMETDTLTVEHSEVLAALLTYLGLNRRRIEMLESKRRSLQDVTRYRAAATRYVTNTLAGLMELEEALEVLRSMVQGADLLDEVSMEVIICALMKGTDRLRQAGSGVTHTLAPLLIA